MPFITLPIDGGLDLVTPPVSVRPGRLQDGENFEVALNQGVRSIDGYERFDGGPSPSISARMWIANITAPYDADAYERMRDNFWIAGTISFDYEYKGVQGDPLVCDVVYSEAIGLTTGSIYFVTRTSADATIASAIFLGGNPSYAPIGSTALARLGAVFNDYRNPNVEIATSFPTTAIKIAVQTAYYNAQRATVQEVPGQSNVLGLFWLKDELYACRDYVTLAYDTSKSTPSYNDELFIGASYAAATWKGFLAKNSIRSSNATTGAAAGLLMFYNTTGTATLATIKNHTQGDIAVATVTAVNASSQGAGLYRADGTRGSTVATQSWTHQDIGYNVRYKEAIADFIPANRVSATTDIADLITSTEWVVPGGQVSSGNWSVFGTAAPSSVWQAVSVDDADDGYAASGLNVAGSSTGVFWVKDFGLTDTDIPDGSTITGFDIEVTRRAFRGGALTGTIMDSGISLNFPLGVSGTPNFANTDALGIWPSSNTKLDNSNYAIAQYGGKQSLLGYTNVTPDAVKSSDFGFRMSAKCTAISATVGSPSADAINSISPHVSLVKIKVYFLPPQSKIYFWDNTSAVIADVVMSYKTSGSIALTTAKGNLFLMAVGTNRAVGADEEIRTMPAVGKTPDGGLLDGSSLIAKTETSMQKNVMDWSSLLTSDGKKPNNSKYQYVTSNFYAAADFDAIYGVSGAGPAFMYDGYAFTRIYTGTPEANDVPRHVNVHQSRMFLGYRSGSVQFSVAGNPLSFDPLAFAGEIGVGAAVRGLMELNGDTLAELTQKGVSMIQGDVGLSPYPGIISPDVGCVEYSAQSMGQFMYTSFRGVQNLRATQSYGDFDTSQFSWDVWSWLRPRVQTSAFFESANIGVINSLSVRNKSQYRLMFADGKQLTATFLREGEMPQYTIQQYYHADGTTPLTWDVVTAGTESNGRDRLFGATNDGTGYVYEIDRGYSFDGGLIEGYCVLSVMDQGSPQQHKEYTDYQVYGLATDYATFTVSRAVGYGEPDPGKRYTHTFGSLTAAPTGSEGYATSATPIRIAGRNITLRYDFSSSTQPPFTLQAISYNIVPGGEKRT